jgi:hypothetical protein
VCVVAALRLEWHGRLLRRTLGSSQFIVGWFTSMQEVGVNEARHLAEQLDDVVHADQGTRVRSTLRMLTRVRNLRALKDIGDSANAIIEPISPGRLALTGYAAIVVGVAVIMSFPVLFCSLVGLALR